eukprot:XP_001691194.1 predicted protein [Chlamydomonas reinhardtii]
MWQGLQVAQAPQLDVPTRQALLTAGQQRRIEFHAYQPEGNMEHDIAIHQIRGDQRPAATAAAKTQGKHQQHHHSTPDTAAPADQPLPVPGVYTALSPHPPISTGTGTSTTSAFAEDAAAPPAAEPGRPASPVSFPLTGPLTAPLPATIGTSPPPKTSPRLAAAEWRDYNSLPRRYRNTVDGLRSLAAARYMEQHWDAARHLDVEVTWDAPPIYLQYAELDSKRTALELFLTAALSPHRPWWLPATWLLPKTIPLQGTVKLRISKGPAADGSQDVVTCIDGAIHNAPKLPTLVRCDKRFWAALSVHVY